jgi:hypothetical protein
MDRDVYAIWDLPAAVLLPRLYALIVPIPRMILTQWRIRRSYLHRRAYNAASIGLARPAGELLQDRLQDGPAISATVTVP